MLSLVLFLNITESPKRMLVCTLKPAVAESLVTDRKRIIMNHIVGIPNKINPWIVNKPLVL